MNTATASTPGWTYRPRTRIEDSNKGRLPAIDISVVGPYRLAKFRRLVAQWRAETSHYSSATEKMNNSAFKAIIEMDEWVVGWIIEELRTTRDFLFLALHKIKKIDPSPPAAKGKPHKIIEAWLLWAERENIKAE